MFDLKWWTTFLTLCFCTAIMAFAFVTRKPLCIDSTLVERIDRVTTSGTKSVYACHLRHHVTFDPYFAENIPRWVSVLKPLEQSIQYSGISPKKVSITVLDHQKMSFRIHGAEVFIGQPLLRDSETISYAVIRALIRSRISRSLLSDPLIETVLADLIFSSVYNDFESLALQVEDNNSAEKFDQRPEKRWLQGLRSKSEYCRSQWRLLEHAESCPSQIRSDDDRLVLPSVRSMLGQSFQRALKTLTSTERLRLHESILTNIGTLEMSTHRFGQTIFQSQSQDFFEIALYIANMFEGLKSSAQQGSPFYKLIDRAQIESQILGFKEDYQQTVVDVLIRRDQIDRDDLQQFSELAFEFSNLDIVLSHKDREVVLPSVKLLPKFRFGPVKAYRTIWFRCGLPAAQEIAGQILETNRILVIDSCIDIEIDLKSYFENGIESFAKKNPKAGFIHIHVPSFLHALKNGQNPFLWDNAEFVKSASAFRNRGPIQAVDWFRGLQP